MFKEDTSSEYLKIIFFTLVLAALAFGSLAPFGVRTAWATETYFNSSELGCDPANPNPDYLMCDDFEDGDWYVTNADISGGRANTANDGWSGTIYADPITPAGAAVCGSKGVAGTNCAATSGLQAGTIGGRNMANHNFAPNQTGYEEIYIRYYYKAEAGYVWGGQKHLTINLPSGSGIKWGGVGFNVGGGGGGGTTTAHPTVCFQKTQVWGNGCAQISAGTQTVAQCGSFCLGLGGGGINPPLEIQPGKWYAMQVHLKLNTLSGTANGVFEFWMDDCGANGLGCTAAPTKRFSRSDIDYDRLNASEKLGNVWQENWANPGSTGTEYYDQYIVSKTGPIPWMGGSPPPPVTAPPPGPSGLTVKP